MDNLPTELQSRLIQLEWCIKNQFQQSSLLALEELTTLLSEYAQIILTAQKNLQQTFSSTQTKPANLLPFPQEINNAQNQAQQKTKTYS